MTKKAVNGNEKQQLGSGGRLVLNVRYKEDEVTFGKMRIGEV